MRFSAGALALLLAVCGLLTAQSPKKSTSPVRKSGPAATDAAAAPPPVIAASPARTDPIERLTYAAEWRMIHAGNVTSESGKHITVLKLESAGLVSTLIKIRDVYTVEYNSALCAVSSVLDSLEGKRHHETKVTFDGAAGRATFLERDLLKNSVIRETGVDIPNCVVETLGGLKKLRTLALPVGQSVQIPTSDGRKFASVKVEAQEREKIKTPLGTFNTMRYEALLLNGVVYPRKGRLFVWISEDEKHLPVQIRLKLPFPIGTVTLRLQKEERL